MKIAIQLRAGRLQGIHVPTSQREGYRILSRLREDLMLQRTRADNKLKSLLHLHGLIPCDESPRICLRWLDSLLKRYYPKEIAKGIQTHCETWKYFDQKIKQVSEEQACDDLALERIYRSAPGIGAVAARTLANELGDMSQFSHEKQLFSYLGLTPSEYSSGEHIRRGKISRQGKSVLRQILVQCAWQAIRKDQQFWMILSV